MKGLYLNCYVNGAEWCRCSTCCVVKYGIRDKDYALTKWIGWIIMWFVYCCDWDERYMCGIEASQISFHWIRRLGKDASSPSSCCFLSFHLMVCLGLVSFYRLIFVAPCANVASNGRVIADDWKCMRFHIATPVNAGRLCLARSREKERI